MNNFKVAAILAALGVAAISSAQTYVYYNLGSADLGLTGHSGSQVLTVGGPPIGPGGTTGIIDFFPSSGAISAGDSTGRSYEAYNFAYQVTASVATAAVGIVFQGTIGGQGKVTFEENIFRVNSDNSEVLVATMSNTLFANGSTSESRGTYTRSGNNYSYVDNEAVLPPLNNYKVKKSFFVEAGNPFNGNVDFASVGFIEQSHQPVPEPAALAVLGVGALGLLGRRRRS